MAVLLLTFLLLVSNVACNNAFMEEAAKSKMMKSSHRLSLVKCGTRPLYENTNDDDGDYWNLVNKIVGGGNAAYGEFPWQASIGLLQYTPTGKTEAHVCGATIINEFWLLSAAHCFGGYDLSQYIITVGNHYRHRQDRWEQQFTIQQYISHEQYSGEPEHFNDIALIKIRPSADGQGIRFNDYVQPACLPDAGHVFNDGSMSLVCGWGRGLSASGALKKAELPLINWQQCKMILHPDRFTDGMMCAGILQGGTGVCNGDSGGGLIVNTGGAYTLLGVASWIPGYPCGKPNAPGVFTYVPKFVAWTSSTIQRHSNNEAESHLPSRP